MMKLGKKKQSVTEKLMVCLDYTYFFYKQPAYKKLALGWQIAKKFSRLNHFLLSNNKNYRLKTSGVFYCNKHNVVEFIMLLKGNLL